MDLGSWILWPSIFYRRQICGFSCKMFSVYKRFKELFPSNSLRIIYHVVYSVMSPNDRLNMAKENRFQWFFEKHVVFYPGRYVVEILWGNSITAAHHQAHPYRLQVVHKPRCDNQWLITNSHCFKCVALGHLAYDVSACLSLQKPYFKRDVIICSIEFVCFMSANLTSN